MLIQHYHKKIPFMVCFVDNFFSIALVAGENGLCKNEQIQFKDDIDGFGIPTWDVNEPLCTVNFLHPTIKINDDYIITRTYQNPINLYHYITPNSAYPPGMIRDMVHGLYREDY